MTPSNLRDVVINHIIDWSAEELVSQDYESIYLWAQTCPDALIMQIMPDNRVRVAAVDHDGFAEPAVVTILWDSIF